MFNIVSAIGSRYYIYTKKLGVTKIILLFSIIMFSLSQIYSVGAIAILIVARFFTSGIWPSINVEFNKLIDSEDRASIISYKNLLISISFIIADPINGIIIDFKNVHYVYFVFAVILLIYFMKRIIKKNQV
ncbi:MFS transporter [Granulicatella balaenopterae]|uniref:MFS transporter n=1 Tax=Granulicatella balaenopterae TaxID=137733 RepID=UPI0038996DDF